MSDTSADRIQKVLSRLGLCSRRAAELWITSGRVVVNGKPAKLGEKITPEDELMVDGVIVNTAPSSTRVLLYNKKIGEVCSRTESPSVFDNLPVLTGGKWIAVGRLDINTSGLLIFTTNGDLANHMAHPRTQLDREYAVRVRGNIDEEVLERLRTGVWLEDGLAKFNDLVHTSSSNSNSWYQLVVREGRNRLVRRLWQSQGCEVSRLMRVRMGNLSLEKGVFPGTAKELSPTQVEKLCSDIGFSLSQ